MPKLVVFDLGRVLVRICDDWVHACEVAGVVAPVEPTCDALRVLKELSHQADVGQLAVDGFCEGLAAATGVSAADARRMSDAFLLGHYDGATELLLELKGRGIETACLSNTNDNHWRILAGEPYTLHHLTHRFASHLVGQRKPEAGIYYAVEQATGRAGEEIVFFDDLTENVLAARSRGWRGHVVPVVENPVPWIRERLSEEGAL